MVFPMSTETPKQRAERLAHEAWCNTLPTIFGDLTRIDEELFFMDSYAGCFPRNMEHSIEAANHVARKCLEDALNCENWGD